MKKILLSLLLLGSVVKSDAVVISYVDESAMPDAMVFEVGWGPDWGDTTFWDEYTNEDPLWAVQARAMPPNDDPGGDWHHVSVGGGYESSILFGFDILFPNGRGFSEVVYDFKGLPPTRIEPSIFGDVYSAKFTFGTPPSSSVPDAGSSALMLVVAVGAVVAARKRQ